jgi:hypothetical protein
MPKAAATSARGRARAPRFRSLMPRTLRPARGEGLLAEAGGQAEAAQLAGDAGGRALGHDLPRGARAW